MIISLWGENNCEDEWIDLSVTKSTKTETNFADICFRTGARW
jgi:hypothetical protein